MIFVINRSDAIGDLTLTLPIFSEIKAKYPKAKTILLASPRAQALAIGHPHIDQIEIYDPKANIVSRIRKIYQTLKGQVDYFVHVGGPLLPAIIAFLMGVKNRGGLKSKWPSFLFLNKGIHQRRSMIELHEVEYNLGLLKPLGFDIDFKNVPFPKLFTTDNDLEIGDSALKEVLAKEQLEERPFIIVHPGMTGHTLNWPAHHYAQFCYVLEERFPNRYHFLISHTPSDAKYISDMKRHAEVMKGHHNHTPNLIYFDGSKVGLRGLMGLIQKSTLLLAPSTGPTHLANSLGSKHVALYSPIKAQSAKRWGPYDRRPELNRTLVPDVICGQEKVCAGRVCPYYPCMEKMDVDEVIHEACALLAERVE